MKDNLKKRIGLLLAVIMIAGMIPFSSVRAEADTYTSNVIGPLLPEEPEEDFGEPDPTADLETEESMFTSLNEVTDRLKGLPYNERLIAVAETQLGYSESETNFIITENKDGKREKAGYTRYGAWYGPGYEYESWCAMFISFCLHYGQVPADIMPLDSGVITWMHTLQAMELFHIATEYTPKQGDFIFFDFDLDGAAEHMGIVNSVYWEDDVEMVETIEGNHTVTVEKFAYPLRSFEIMGYGEMSSEIPENEKERQLSADYYSGDGSTYRVTLTYTSEANLPDASVLIVREITPGTPEYDAYVAESEGALGWDEGSASEAKVFDISVYFDGAEVQPEAPVSVEILLLDQGADEWNVVRFGEEEAPQVLESSFEGDALSFEM